MDFLLSFIKARYQPMGRQVCLTMPQATWSISGKLACMFLEEGDQSFGMFVEVLICIKPASVSKWCRLIRSNPNNVVLCWRCIHDFLDVIHPGMNDIQEIMDATPTENDIVWIGPDQATPFGNGSRFDAYQYFNEHPEALIAFLEEHTS